MRMHALLLVSVVAGCGGTSESKTPAPPRLAVQALPQEEETELMVVEKPHAAVAGEKPADVPEPMRMSKKHPSLLTKPAGEK